MSAWLVIFCLICVAAADECSKTCEKNTGEGCDGRWKVGGEVVMCAERSRYGVRCITSCEHEGEEYTWCKTGVSWDYCGLEGVTTRGEDCIQECSMGNKAYWWCETDAEDATKWDYCSPHKKVMKVHYASNGQECGGECGQQGEDYWWCAKPQRTAGKNNNDSPWSYCSPGPNVTRLNKPCLDECSTRGSDNFWCNIEGDSWDYCSPPAPTTSVPVMTRGGEQCMGVCDSYSSSYQYCASMGLEDAAWWDYCGSGSNPLSPGLFWIILLFSVLMCKVY